MFRSIITVDCYWSNYFVRMRHADPIRSTEYHVTQLNSLCCIARDRYFYISLYQIVIFIPNSNTSTSSTEYIKINSVTIEGEKEIIGGVRFIARATFHSKRPFVECWIHMSFIGIAKNTISKFYTIIRAHRVICTVSKRYKIQFKLN